MGAEISIEIFHPSKLIQNLGGSAVSTSDDPPTLYIPLPSLDFQQFAHTLEFSD
jgi:hypothetical protein